MSCYFSLWAMKRLVLSTSAWIQTTWKDARPTFSPAARPLANRPQAPQKDVHIERKNATTAPTVSQFAFP